VPCMRSWHDDFDDEVLWFGRSALLIPARNAEGLINGIHVKPHRNDISAGESKGKYMWASVARSVRLPDGGFPIFCCWYDWSPADTVALIEGGLKPCIFAHLAARVKVIGAAGGQFWQSRVELVQALARLGARRVVLFPDAGAVANFSVLLNYFRTFQLLQDWSVEIRIAWWGQADKLVGLDADDLLSQVSNVEIGRMSMLYISEFWNHVPNHIRGRAMQGRHSEVFDQVLAVREAGGEPVCVA